MLIPVSETEKSLIIKSVVSAIKDIDKLNSRAYNFLYLASGFIAHYNLSGFQDYYRENSLKDDIIRHRINNLWLNFAPGEQDYEYYHQKGEIYAEIVDIISAFPEISLKAQFCKTCGHRIS